ncbi:MAG: hypothetical protein ACLVAW_26710 [Eisenbergiella massiliensis]
MIRFMKSKFRRGMPQAAVLLAVLLAVLTAGCGNNVAAPEMTDRGNKKNQSDAEVTSAPEKQGTESRS